VFGLWTTVAVRRVPIRDACTFLQFLKLCGSVPRVQWFHLDSDMRLSHYPDAFSDDYSPNVWMTGWERA
jgi:hypothetical protein